MVAENKKVRLSLGITFKILSTWEKQRNPGHRSNTSKCEELVSLLLYLRLCSYYKPKLWRFALEISTMLQWMKARVNAKLTSVVLDINDSGEFFNNPPQSQSPCWGFCLLRPWPKTSELVRRNLWCSPSGLSTDRVWLQTHLFYLCWSYVWNIVVWTGKGIMFWYISI